MTYRERMRELGCIVVMPTYNNAGTLARVIGDVLQYAEDVLVVNDGSRFWSRSTAFAFTATRKIAVRGTP